MIVKKEQMGFLVFDSVYQVSLKIALSYNFCETILAFRIVKRWVQQLERNKGNKEKALKQATEGIDCNNTQNKKEWKFIEVTFIH